MFSTEERKLMYKEFPHLLARDFSEEPLLFPPKIREIFNAIWGKALRGEMIRTVLCGPRGGGKTRVIASLEAALWYLLDWDVVNLGGSLVQAKKAYSYLMPIFNSSMVKPELEKSIQEITKKKNSGSEIHVLASTEKQTRSPHIGGRKRGGLLIIDEECEADERVVSSALSIVNTAHPSAIVRSSTFHKAFGSYQKVWDKADEMGYERFKWDIFDVAEKCKDECSAIKDEKTGKTAPCNVLNYCSGRAHAGEGWVSIREIRQYKREMTNEDFEIEFMGSRPSSAGLVFRPDHLMRTFTEEVFKEIPKGNCSIGIDWGWEGETSIVKLQQQYVEALNRRIHRVVHYEYYKRPRSTELYAELELLSRGWKIPIYADSSHKFNNDDLTNLGAYLQEVPFVRLKEYGIRNIIKMLEDETIQIPEAYEHLCSQMRGYRRGPTGRPVKGDDHGVDALLCAGIHFSNEGWGNTDSDKLCQIFDTFRRRGGRSGY